MYHIYIVCLVFENVTADYSKNHSSENLTVETNKEGARLITQGWSQFTANFIPLIFTGNLGLTPSSSSTSLSAVSAQSPIVDSPLTSQEERLQQQVRLLQSQVALLENQLDKILNKPKRGVRVQDHTQSIIYNFPIVKFS